MLLTDDFLDLKVEGVVWKEAERVEGLGVVEPAEVRKRCAKTAAWRGAEDEEAVRSFEAALLMCRLRLMMDCGPSGEGVKATLSSSRQAGTS